MILVIGTNDSGKSAFAEQLAISINSSAGDCKSIAYIATMIPLDEDGEKRIKKHRNQRAGKGFVTFEEPYNVSSLMNVLVTEEFDTVLLECVSNLVGNVMHSDAYKDKAVEEDVMHGDAHKGAYGVTDFESEITEKVITDICLLDEKIKNLIVVTNYFDIVGEYDDETKKYIRINNTVTDRLKKLSKQYALKSEGGFELYDNN